MSSGPDLLETFRRRYRDGTMWGERRTHLFAHEDTVLCLRSRSLVPTVIPVVTGGVTVYMTSYESR